MPLPSRPNLLDESWDADTQGAIPTLISIPCLDSFSQEDLTAAGDSLGRRHATVWEMAESGLAAEAISTSTGQPIGEIELILALKRQIQSMRPAE